MEGKPDTWLLALVIPSLKTSALPSTFSVLTSPWTPTCAIARPSRRWPASSSTSRRLKSPGNPPSARLSKPVTRSSIPFAWSSSPPYSQSIDAFSS
ncbi:hypothetical protein BKA70DRAFT_1286321 [Coprinopsis sp. MPI-PUGE-AT-0042]|nr:hypothetical protein BKA70DRAFT_1286321 [Coprinopsis sp. MPI-PUGE-AT-0042]